MFFASARCVLPMKLLHQRLLRRIDMSDARARRLLVSSEDVNHAAVGQEGHGEAWHGGERCLQIERRREGGGSLCEKPEPLLRRLRFGSRLPFTSEKPRDLIRWLPALRGTDVDQNTHA